MPATSIVTTPITRATIRSGRPYAELRTAFERELGIYDMDVGGRLVEASASWTTVCQTIGAMVGPHGLVLMHRIDQGQIASLKGEPRHCTLYLVGNPLIAAGIVDIDLRAGMLVPFRVEIYDEGECGVISYDLPSSSLASLGRPELDAIGTDLDAKIAAVATALDQATIA